MCGYCKIPLILLLSCSSSYSNAYVFHAPAQTAVTALRATGKEISHQSTGSGVHNLNKDPSMSYGGSCGCLQYIDPVTNKCWLSPRFYGLCCALVLYVAVSSGRLHYNSLESKKMLGEPCSEVEDIQVDNNKGEMDTVMEASIWRQWERFWQSDFHPYGQTGMNQAIFLIAALFLNVWSGQEFPVFGESPLSAPHFVDLAPAPFLTETYPANVFAAHANVPVLFALRWVILSTWVASIPLLVHCPQSTVTKLCVTVTAGIYVYFNALSMSFIGCAHTYQAMVWVMAGLAVSVCTGDDGSWLKKFVLLVLCTTYVAAGIAKHLNSGYLWWRGDVLEFYLEKANTAPRNEGGGLDGVGVYNPLLNLLLDHRVLIHLLAVGTMIFELGMVFFLLPALRTMRWFGYLSILGFHFGIFLCMNIHYHAQCSCLFLVVDLLPAMPRRPLKGTRLRASFTAATVLAWSAAILFQVEFWPVTNVPMYSMAPLASPSDNTWASHALFFDQARACGGRFKHQYCDDGFTENMILSVSGGDAKWTELGWGSDSKVKTFHSDRIASLESSWELMLFRATGMHILTLVQEDAYHVNNKTKSPLNEVNSLLTRFGPWLIQASGNCDSKSSNNSEARIRLEPRLTKEALKTEGRLLIAEVRLKSPCDQ
eukprot:TRINITY_DN11294_c0_g1_i1.p1 TRINITY_DN11294_c0_g1~~TRINITY_DN11294_c0_g1_i1.p1  ORF type:complete len:652 (-),score=85.10 TRINITY_DN11294_c0_g1_i1:206-2161(-)